MHRKSLKFISTAVSLWILLKQQRTRGLCLAVRNNSKITGVVCNYLEKDFQEAKIQAPGEPQCFLAEHGSLKEYKFGVTNPLIFVDEAIRQLYESHSLLRKDFKIFPFV